MQKFIYFDAKHAIEVHDWIIDNSGGLAGMERQELLESPLGHIQNDDYYPEMEDKLTHLIFSIIKNHAFNDGNKRSSIALGAYFLELNGYEYCLKDLVFCMENYAVWVADNLVSKHLLFKIIFSILYEIDYSEELKLEIANSISNS
jgi:death-on-curing protein